MDCFKKEENLADCSCIYPGCPRKGKCCECIKHHKRKGELPACYFSKEKEKAYDRSIDNFINEWKKN